MNKDLYLYIRNNPTQDTMPVLLFYFNLKSNLKMDMGEFNHYFSLWLRRSGAVMILGSIIYGVFKELDKYFVVN